MGPLPGETNPSLSKLFPAYYKTRPLVSKNKIDEDGRPILVDLDSAEDTSTVTPSALEKIRLNYITNFLIVFRSIPLEKDPELYYAWLTRVEKHKASF